MTTEQPSTLFPARDQALTLLDELAQDSLEQTLAEIDSMTPSELREYGVSAKFKWLHDLIVENIHA